MFEQLNCRAFNMAPPCTVFGAHHIRYHPDLVSHVVPFPCEIPGIDHDFNFGIPAAASSLSSPCLWLRSAARL
jgi:hypothetical protein